MATLTVDFTTSTKLNCALCLPADVVLCVPVSLDALSVTGSETGIIYGIITAASTSGAYYVYTISYDDTQLEPDTELLPELIQGIFCEGCMTNWVRELIRRDLGVDISI